MPHLSVGSAIDVARVSSDTPWCELLEIEVIDTDGSHIDWIRVARNNEPITFGGEVYQPGNFGVEIQAEVGQEPRIAISVEDYNGLVRSAIDKYDGGGDFPVTYTLLNTARLDQPPEIQEHFKVTSATSSGDWKVSFQLGVDGAFSKRFPRRAQFARRCSWVYKDSRCAYAGELVACDYTYDGTNGCAAHDNVANFGGFPGLVNR